MNYYGEKQQHKIGYKVEHLMYQIWTLFHFLFWTMGSVFQDAAYSNLFHILELKQ